MRIVVHLLAIALIGTWMTQASLAAEPAGDSGGSAVSAKPNGTRPTRGDDAAAAGAKLYNHLAPDPTGDSKPGTGESGQKGTAVGQDVKPSTIGGKDSDAIDTRITVQPRRLGGRSAVREGETRRRPLAPRMFQPRRWSAPEGSRQVTRDAIGLPVAHHDGIEQGNGQRHDLPALVHDPAAATTGFGANASGGLARTGGPFGHPLNANPIVRPSGLNPGTINGTNLARRGSGPSSIGGPTKPIAGISGTTIRPKQ